MSLIFVRSLVDVLDRRNDHRLFVLESAEYYLFKQRHTWSILLHGLYILIGITFVEKFSVDFGWKRTVTFSIH